MARLDLLGCLTQLVPLKTTGDIDLVSPIYAMGVTGVFTKELDTALLSHQADVAVHSLKDVPTILPLGLQIAAVLERASVHDVLIYKTGIDPELLTLATIATSSIRRRSQWLHRHPGHTMVNVRGNVETRLRKFEDEGWDGIIFAKAGLERLGLLPPEFKVLDWMTPAPSQGAIAVVCRINDPEVLKKCNQINHADSALAVMIERDFLYHLEGGCSVPISALAFLSNGVIKFSGAIHSLDGQREERIERSFAKEQWTSAGLMAATAIRDTANGRSILEEFRQLNRR